jgi:hypothetical protein
VKRIVLLLSVALVVAAMAVAMAMPALAAPFDQRVSDQSANMAKYNDCEHQHPQGNYCENKFL